MTTATQTYTIRRDAENDCYDILTADGELMGCEDTLAAAKAEIAAWEREAEVETLTAAIIDRINEAETASDLATLRRVAAMLGL